MSEIVNLITETEVTVEVSVSTEAPTIVTEETDVVTVTINQGPQGVQGPMGTPGDFALSDVAPQDVGIAAAGVADTASRGDHVHAHGNQAGGSLHALAVAAGAAGFLSGADKTQLDNLAANLAALAAAIAGKQDTGNYLTALTGDVTASGPGSAAATIAAHAVSNAKAAQMAALTMKGNDASSTGDQADLTVAQIRALLKLGGLKIARPPFEDFVTGGAQGSTGWTPSANGGAVAQHNGATFGALHPGVIELRTGSSSSAAPSMNLGINIWLAGSGELFFEAVVQLDALSDGTDTVKTRIGFGDSLTGTDPTDGIWLEAIHNVNSGQWTMNAASSAVKTTVNGGVAAAAGAWFRAKIVVVAADGSSASGYIDDVLVATVSTNIPKTTGRTFGLQISHTKSAGTTQRILYLDSVDMYQTLTTSR